MNTKYLALFLICFLITPFAKADEEIIEGVYEQAVADYPDHTSEVIEKIVDPKTRRELRRLRFKDGERRKFRTGERIKVRGRKFNKARLRSRVAQEIVEQEIEVVAADTLE